MALQRATRMTQALRRQVGGMGLFWRIEDADVSALPGNSYGCRPFLGDAPSSPFRDACNAKQPALVCARRSHVLRIDAPGCFTKIAPTVVGSIAIDVIYFGRRPRASHVEPRESVDVEMALQCPNNDIAECGIFATEQPTSWCLANPRPSARKTPKLAGGMVVSVMRSQFMNADIGFQNGP